MRLKELREKAGLAQKDLVQRAGVAQWTVSDMETRQRRVPRVDTLGRLADVLAPEIGVSPEQIVAELAVDAYRQLKAKRESARRRSE